MPSAIDPTKPVAGTPTTDSVRQNFATAKTEIEALQSKVTKYTINGPLEITTGTLRWYPEKNITITKVYYSLGVAGSGTSEIDVKKTGTTIFGTRPSAASGQYKSTEQTVSVSVTTTDYVTVDVTQTGNAQDAVVTIVYQ